MDHAKDFMVKNNRVTRFLNSNFVVKECMLHLVFPGQIGYVLSSPLASLTYRKKYSSGSNCDDLPETSVNSITFQVL